MSIRVELELDDGSFTTRMVHAGESVDNFRQHVNGTITSVNRLNEATGSLFGALRDITITVGMARAAFENIRAVTSGWAGDIIKVNAEMEKLGFLLGGLSKAKDPTKDAADGIKFLRQEALNAPFALGALTDTFVKMKSTGLDPLAGGFKSMVNAVAAFGGTDDVLKRATIAITQMSGKGVIQMEELRQQLGEAVPRAVEVMARSIGLSTGQLIVQISKGTLESKQALASFFAELDLTFGGSAQAQMKTFNGMISQSSTLFQSLALVVGDAGFFNAVKNQLRDINTFLGGSMANSFAASLGQGLTAVVEGLRSALGTAMEFKSEIIGLGEAMVVAFGAKAVAGALLGMGQMFRSMSADIATSRLQWSQFANGMAGTGGMIAGVRSLSDAFTATALTAGGLARVIPIIASGLTMIAAYAPLLVLGIGLLAIAFSTLGDKTKDAYEHLVKYGAESEKQIALAARHVAMEEQRLELMKASQQNPTDFNGEYAPQVSSNEDISAKETEVNDKRRVLSDETVKLAQKQADKLRALMDSDVEDELRGLSKGYDERATLAAKNYSDQLQLRQTARQSTEQTTKDFQASQRDAAIAGYTDREAILETYLRNSQLMQEMGNKEAIAAGVKFDAAMTARIRENAEARARLQASKTGPQEIDKPQDIEKLLQKAAAKTDDVASATAGLRAQLAGVSGEYATLAFMINEAASKSKNMGPLDNVRIKAATDALLQQQAVFDEYTRRVNAQNKTDTELMRINLALREKIAAQEAGGDGKTNDVDKFRKGVAAGAYSGLTATQQMQQRFAELSTSAKTVGDDMKAAFLSILPPINSVVERLSLANTGLKQLPGALSRTGGLNLPSVSSGSPLTDRLINSESGGNPTATNKDSTATGAAQFIESTWLDFMKSMHPDILKQGEAIALAWRNNADMSKEATAWYANENSKKFSENGIASSDANLKLGHFLGGGGATAALSKPDDTLVRTIPELTRAIKDNYAVFKNISTVGDLKDWAKGQVGGGTTFKPFYDTDSRERSPAGLSAKQKLIDANNAELQQIAAANEARKALTDAEKAALTAATAAREDNGGKLSSYAAGRKQISDGEGPYGKANTNPDDPLFANYMAALQKKDAAEAASSAKKVALTKFEAIVEKQATDAVANDAKQADILDRIDEERKFKFSGAYTSQLRQLEKDKAAGAAAVSTTAKTQPEADAMIAKQTQAVKDMGDREILEAVRTEQAKTITIEKSLMTTDEARQKDFQENVTRNQQYLENYSATGDARVVVEQQVTRNIVALQKQQFQLTPIGGMLKQWGDLSHNLEQASTGWMNTFNDKLAQMVIHGQVSFRGLVQSIEADLISLGLKAAESKLFSSMLGLGGFSAGPTTLGGPNGPTPFGHNGMMVGGAPTFTRNVDFSAFIGAPKFHSGGFPGLDSSEVPIIAKKGEQVGWPEDLAKQYGGGKGGSSFQMGDINVSGASNGSPAQNKDLAAQIATQVQESAKAMVGGEIRNQMRPGGQIHAMMKGR
jgi:tape measure domain-containing protein